MLESEVTVTVTREDEHQRLLARYPVAVGMQRSVAVELGWCTIGAGKYRGQPAIEVRLDGYRVGELTYAMSRRYTPALTHVTSRGGRPGCEAVIQPGTKGLEIALRLPRHTAGVVALPGGHAPPGPVVRPRPTVSGPWSGSTGPQRPTGPQQPIGPQRPSWPHPIGGPPAPLTGPPVRPVPAAQQQARPPQRVASHRPWWIAAAVVAVLFVAAVAANDDEPSTTNTAADSVTTTTVAPATTTTTVAPTTTIEAPVVATPAPEPAPVAQPPAPKAAPKPVPPPPPPAPAKPEPQCDPNYSGCVPVASDVDCKGGSGNGPAYVAGPIRVTGTDIYGLDNDKDGIACE